jgi:glutathione S-transferase
VHIPSIMPKPDVMALTGGYRKTPFLQIGSDIYCDSALICDVLEHLQPNPSIFPAAHKGLSRILAQWADEKLFWAAMAYNFHPNGAAQMFGSAFGEGAPPEKWAHIAKAFAEDRNAMRTGMPRMPWPDAASAYKSYLRRLANMLEGQEFLLGNLPTLADFSAYHPLWFTRTRTPVMADVLNATPTVLAWMDRMAALGHGQVSETTSAEAIALCAAATSRGGILTDHTFQDDHGIPLGSQVTVTAESFGPEPTEGELVAATRMHYTLRRVDARAGTVHVHFPRVGFSLKKAAA